MGWTVDEISSPAARKLAARARAASAAGSSTAVNSAADRSTSTGVRGKAGAAAAPQSGIVGAHSLAAVETVRRDPANYSLSIKELVWVTSQLALMLETGTNIVDALQTLVDQSENEDMAAMFAHIISCISSGDGLPEVLGLYPATFNRHYVASVRAGEAAGNLPEIFRQLENHLLRRQATAHSVMMALAYPGVIFTLAIFALTFITVYVLPKFAKIYASQNVELPLPTRMLIFFSSTVHNDWPALLVIGAALVAGIMWLARSPIHKPWRDRYLLQLPILGEIMNDYQLGCVARIIGMLLGAGMPLVETFEVARQATSNAVYRGVIGQMTQSIVQGESLGTVIMRVDIINPSLRQMIRTGEQSGALARVLSKIADHLEEENRKKLAALSAILEPMVIILLGVMIGFIALALLLPIFKLSSTVARH